jgi:hypothetical protein
MERYRQRHRKWETEDEKAFKNPMEVKLRNEKLCYFV